MILYSVSLYSSKTILNISVIYVNYNYNENSKIMWKKLDVNDNYNYNEIIANNYN